MKDDKKIERLEKSVSNTISNDPQLRAEQYAIEQEGISKATDRIPHAVLTAMPNEPEEFTLYPDLLPETIKHYILALRAHCAALQRDAEPTSWQQWTVRALVRLAIRTLADANKNAGNNWPAGQEWHELSHTSQHAFMRSAMREAKIPHDEYRNSVEAAMLTGAPLDDVWSDLTEENKAMLLAAEREAK